MYGVPRVKAAPPPARVTLPDLPAPAPTPIPEATVTVILHDRRDGCHPPVSVVAVTLDATRAAEILGQDRRELYLETAVVRTPRGAWAEPATRARDDFHDLFDRLMWSERRRHSAEAVRGACQQLYRAAYLALQGDDLRPAPRGPGRPLHPEPDTIGPLRRALQAVSVALRGHLEPAVPDATPEDALARAVAGLRAVTHERTRAADTPVGRAWAAVDLALTPTGETLEDALRLLGRAGWTLGHAPGARDHRRWQVHTGTPLAFTGKTWPEALHRALASDLYAELTGRSALPGDPLDPPPPPSPSRPPAPPEPPKSA